MNLEQQQAKISQKATQKQLQASHPLSSVWVSASAGTGKTHVLTQRILRLLLNDQSLQISEILAITYTKAAAVEMQNRLIEKLSDWLEMSDYKLMDELDVLLQRKPTTKDLIYARTLLTKVIDDAVGLNISTTHSFCDKLLRKFPLEAGIPSSFTLIEERDSNRLLRKAWFKALKQQTETNKDLFYNVINLMGEYSLTDAVNNVLAKHKRFYTMLEKAGGINNFLQNLTQEFNITELDENKIYQQILDFDLTTKDNLKEIMSLALNDKGKRSKETGEKIDKVLAQDGKTKDLIKLYISIFTKADGDVKSSSYIVSKKITEIVSFDFDEFKQEEFDRINNILDKVTDLQNYKISQVICILADQMFKFYNQEKKALSYLDFDDLIYYAEKLVNKVDVQDWIRYKLDSKIKHCLIDEAQDTDIQQWNILHGIVQEFYFGDGQHEKGRTTFVVGDMKQSIYRFRGANPEVFAKIRDDIGQASQTVNHDFKQVDLHTSFRSTQAVLNFVDEVFNQPERKKALDGNAESLHHQVYRYDQEGRIEIMPLLTKNDLPKDDENQDKNKGYEIPTEVKSVKEIKSLRQLDYQRIATKIKHMLDFNIHSAKDIIILQRSRSGMPDLIEELTKLNIPHTGADEIYLSDSVIIDDLLAFAKFLCFENDDLSLLQILKSPIFNYDDKTLFSYFADYKKNRKQINFYQYIKNIENFNYVVTKLDKLKTMVNNTKIFDLYIEILNSLDVSEKLMANLGGNIEAQQNQVKDTIDEFLKQIQSFNQMSLLLFLDWFKSSNSKIKKNTANAKNAVRLMTVHGSKGLEANVVFLPDCERDSVEKNGVNYEKLLFKQNENKQDVSFIYKTRSTAKPSKLEQQIAEEQKQLFFEDDMRLLYVALTRARAEVYVSAVNDSDKELSEYSWYSILSKVMEYRIENKSAGYEQLPDGAMVYKTAALIDSNKKQSVEIEEQELEIPTWVNKQAINEQSVIQERASYNLTSQDYIDSIKSQEQINYRYGNLVHKLLEELPKISKENYDKHIDNLLDETTLDVKAQVLNVLAKYPELFAENGKSEVAIQGIYNNKKVAGFVDRLVETEDKVYVIDYKTGVKNNNYMQKYKQQLQLYSQVLKNVYPHKLIVPAILWVSNAELEVV